MKKAEVLFTVTEQLHINKGINSDIYSLFYSLIKLIAFL